MITLATGNLIKGSGGTSVVYSIFGLVGDTTYELLAQGTLSASETTLFTAADTTLIQLITLASTTSATQAAVLSVDTSGTSYNIANLSVPELGSVTITGDISVYDSDGNLVLTKGTVDRAEALSRISALPNGAAGTTNHLGTGMTLYHISGGSAGESFSDGTVASLLGDNATYVANCTYVDQAMPLLFPATISQHTFNIGTKPRRSGRFTITKQSASWTPGDQVIVQLAADPDELDSIEFTGVVTTSTTIRVDWISETFVCRNHTVNYWLAY